MENVYLYTRQSIMIIEIKVYSTISGKSAAEKYTLIVMHLTYKIPFWMSMEI